MNQNDIIVFDFETGGLDPDFHEAIQVAGKAYHGRTLEPYSADEGGEFESLMRPLYPDRLQDEALAINGKTRDMLLGNDAKGTKPAPDQGVVWNQFISWVKRFNTKGTKWTAPIAAGKNIRDFDLRFAAKLNELHSKKKDKTVLFGTKYVLDLDDLMFLWFENESEPANYKMDTLRPYFGMSKEGGHDALVDCRQTGDLIMRFLKLHRELQRRTGKDGGRFIKFEGCCREKAA